MNIPATLRGHAQWVTWRNINGRKMPFDARTGKPASSTDPATWATYDEAVSAAQRNKHDGVGFVFSADDGFAGIDLDDCIDEQGTIAPWAQTIIDTMASYSEISPSGTGVKIFVEGEIPSSVKTKHIEVYDRARYFTVTGQHVDGTPLDVRYVNGQLQALHAQVSPKAAPAPTAPTMTTRTADRAYLQKWADDKVAHAVNEVRNATDGERHNKRLDMARLLGGVAAHNLITDDEIVNLLYHAQVPKHKAQCSELKTLRDGIALGRTTPLDLPEPPPQPVFDEQGFACCPKHKVRVPKATNGNGYKCKQRDESELNRWCKFWWQGEGYVEPATPADDTPAENVHIPVRPAKELIHADELDKLPPPTFLDDEGELISNSTVVVFGPSGCGKSFYTLSKAYDLAEDRDVVYVAAEGASGYAARKNALCMHHKRGAGRLFFWRYAVNLMNPAEVQEFIGAIAGLDNPVVIFDTLARCMVGGDENSTRDMGLAISSCDTIRQATGETVMIVHHTGKNGAGERGSTALRGAADMMIELQNNDGLIEVSCSKMKDGAPFEPRKLRLMEVGESCVLVPADQVISTTAAPLSEHQRKVLETLTLAIFEDVGAKAKDLEVGTKLPHAGLFRTLSALKNLGYISQSTKGDPYYITPAGRDKLADHDHKASQRSISKKGSKQARVSIVSNSINTVSDTGSIKYQAVSHPFRGDTADTDTTAERDTHTHDPLEHLPNVPQGPTLTPNAKRDADARHAEHFTALLVHGNVKEAARVAARIHDEAMRRRCAVELCKELHTHEKDLHA